MSRFTLTRSAHVDADPARVHDLVDDLRAWQQWSPWEGLDPDLRREYAGPPRGPGATYHWRGNKKAGEGRMEITSSHQERIELDLAFVKPFEARNEVRFDLDPGAGGTDVTWTMTGQRNPLMQLMGRLFFDRMIGRDLDRGLAQLKATAES